MVNNSAVLFCGMIGALFVGTLIGAVVLQRACALVNLFARVSGKQAGANMAWPAHALNSEEDWELYDRIATLPGVPKPGFDRAARIVLFATLVNVPGTLIIFQFLRVAGRLSGYVLHGPILVACVALLMGILTLAGINTVMLPTHFGKGLLVSLLSHFFAAILAAIIVLIVLAAGLQNGIHFPQ